MAHASPNNRRKFTADWLKTVKPTPGAQSYDVFYDTQQPGLALRISPRGKRTFFVQTKKHGRQIRETLGSADAVKLPQARTQAEKILAEYTLNFAAKIGEKLQGKELTLGELWEDYRDNRKRKRKDADSSSLKSQWTAHLSQWKNKRLDELTRATVRRHILTLRKTTGGPGANRVQVMGKAMYAHAAKNLGYQGENPFDFDKASEAGRRRDRRLTKQERKRFRRELEKIRNPVVRDWIRLAIYTGRRAGDLRKMRYADIDLETGSWRIGVTKTGDVQRIFLPTLALELVKRAQRERGGVYVLPGRKAKDSDPERPMAGGGYRKAWDGILERAKIENFRFADLRHESASAEFEREVEKLVGKIGERLGHADAVMTNSYIHAAAEIQRSMADAALSDWADE